MTTAVTPTPPRRRDSSRRRLIAFLTRRLVSFLAIMVGITLVAFLLTHLVPADPVAAALGPDAAGDPIAVAAYRERYGLDRPLPVQYIAYITNVFQGDLGKSIRTGRPVAADLSRAIPATLELAFTAIVLISVLGMTLGTVSGMNRDKPIDQIIKVITLSGLSMPTFWFGLTMSFIFFHKLGLVPSGGRLDPPLSPPVTVTGSYIIDSLLAGNMVNFNSALAHIILPAMVVSMHGISVITRFTRTAVLEVLQADYVMVARAKGLPEFSVVTGYVLRAALVPIITVLGIAFGGLLTGAVLTENIFSWPGVGQYAYLSAVNLDVNGIMGVCLFVGFIYTAVNLCVDIAYGFIDPRIRAG